MDDEITRPEPARRSAEAPGGRHARSARAEERGDAVVSLSRSEASFRQIFESSNDAIMLLDPGRDLILAANPRAATMLGYSRSELLGLPISAVHPDELPRLRRFVESVVESGQGWTDELRCRTRTGERLPTEISASPTEVDGRPCILAIVRDISERQQAEEALHRLQLETAYLQEELETAYAFDEIVGESPAIKKVLAEARAVAATDATVLISGETGTGKELVARAIHRLSPRAAKPLVRLNCAALPASLVESELFGHEKGAFTGAESRRLGRFELAHGGTLFLDEVGDLPSRLQAKLLRVLQSGELERVGGSESLRVEVRIIAATNRDLEKAVEDGTFRADLFYRLNVVPIHLPPLRDRRQDTPILARHFVMKHAAKLGKHIQELPQATLEALVAYPWPGNIRELENVVERGVILSDGPRLEVGDWLPASAEAAAGTRTALTLGEVQRRHILKVLEMTRWRVSGKGGAAEILGLKPTTLEARMKKLGIRRQLRESLLSPVGDGAPNMS